MRGAALVVALVFAARALAAPSHISPNVGPSSGGYELADRLEALGCGAETLRSIRPQSYADLREAILPSGGAACTEAETSILEERNGWTSGRMRPGVSVEGVALARDSALSLPGIAAQVQPVFPLHAARPVDAGLNLFVEPSVSLVAGEILEVATAVTAGAAGSWKDGGSPAGSVYLREGYVTVGYRSLQASIGRWEAAFGDGKHGNLALSGASVPLTGVRGTVRPSALPVTYDTWMAGSGSVNLWGTTFGIRPVWWLELGVLTLNQYNRSGPSLSEGDVIKMFLYSGDPVLASKRNREMALNLSVWAPGHAAKTYFQMAFESLSRPSRWLTDDASVLVGLWLPRLPLVDVRLEYVHTAPTAYQYAYLGQGLTYRGTPLGHPLGPDAEGGYLDVGFPDLFGLHPELGLFSEARGIHPGAFVPATERRLGAGALLRRRWQNWTVEAEARWAHVSNHLFEPNAAADVVGLRGEVSVSF